MIVLFFYKFISFLAFPFVYLLLIYRKYKGKEDKQRFHERLGHPNYPRPKGKLLWLHGASVGECLSMLSLIELILEKNPNIHIMVTSGTLTSAALMQKRLPKNAFHQYIPVDLPLAASRFINHFKPDAAFWFESEFWPNLLLEIKLKNIPLFLLNGRISNKSFKNWKKLGFFIRPLLNLFTCTFGQSAQDAKRLSILGSSNVISTGNLKYAAKIIPFNTQELANIHLKLKNRPCFCIGSTHPNEEEMFAHIFIELKKTYPNLFMVVAPRHPERRQSLEKMFHSFHLKVAIRSQNDEITPKTDIYLADTLGEMALIYQIAPVVFVGGSLIKFGGQNMLEPMRFKKIVCIGPYAFNFTQIVQEATSQNALIQINSPQDFISVFKNTMENKNQKIAENAFQFATSQSQVALRIYQKLQHFLDFLK